MKLARRDLDVGEPGRQRWHVQLRVAVASPCNDRTIGAPRHGVIEASGNFDVPLVFAGLVILAVMGVMLYGVSSFIESRLTGWAQRGNEVVMA